MALYGKTDPDTKNLISKFLYQLKINGEVRKVGLGQWEAI